MSASAATSIWRSIAHSTRWRSAIWLAHSITSGTPAVSARSVSQTISERRCCVPQQRGGRGGVVAFDRLGPRLREHLEQAAQVPRAAIGRDPRVDAAAVGDEPDAIAGRLRDVRQRQRRVDGGIELGAIAGARAQQAAAVEHDPHRLAALGPIEAGDELAAPRRRRPADVAPIVAVAVVAQPLELAAGAVLARPPPLGDQRLAAHQVQHVVLRRVEVGVDAHRLLDRHARPARRRASRRSRSAP